MSSKPLHKAWTVLCLLPLACSQGGEQEKAQSDDRLFVPEELPNTELGAEGGLTLIALTLLLGDNGPELYAAVRNDGDTPACEAGMTTDFIDKTGQVLATSGSVLQSGRIYRLDGGAGVAISCVAPGQIAMAASTELADGVALEELASLEHRFPAFTVDGIVAVDAVDVGEITATVSDDETAYRGTLTNGIDVPVSDPRVAVFPVNRVGRPLGVATSAERIEVAPGATWTFETSGVNDPGVGAVAYPAASLP